MNQKPRVSAAFVLRGGKFFTVFFPPMRAHSTRVSCYTIRVKFLDPHDALKQFGVYGTQDVADIGTGSGHFALHAAKRLDGGRLFAVDIEKEMLSRLVAEARHAGQCLRR